VSVLINKALSGFNFCNTVKHEQAQAVNNYKIHSKRLRGRREGGSDMEERKLGSEKDTVAGFGGSKTWRQDCMDRYSDS
jgi:hypothetical protein